MQHLISMLRDYATGATDHNEFGAVEFPQHTAFDAEVQRSRC